MLNKKAKKHFEGEDNPNNVASFFRKTGKRYVIVNYDLLKDDSVSECAQSDMCLIFPLSFFVCLNQFFSLKCS